MERDVYTISGQKTGSVFLSNQVFATKVSSGSIYHAIRNELANSRVGSSCTKTRSEVNLRHQKPYRQKGTGRARAGRTSSPIFVGGGVVFGPRPRSYSYSMPRKVKKLAMRSILTMKTINNAISLVEDFTIKTGRTQDLLLILGAFLLTDKRKKIVVIMGSDDLMVRRAGKNLPNVDFFVYHRLGAHKLFYADRLLIFRSAIIELGKFYDY